MPWIGIETDLGLVYEGGYRYGHAVLPTPITAPAAIVSEADFPPKLPERYALNTAEVAFREDSYDAVTRVRRGRFYLASQTRPEEWLVYPHPSRPTEAELEKPYTGRVKRKLFTFQPLPTPNIVQEIQSRGGRPLVAIGTESYFTIWTISSIEGTSAAEFVVTLRGRQTFGAIPEVNSDAIPQSCRRAVLDAISKLRDDVFSAGPISVVDRARDVASAALSGYLQDLDAIKPGRELDELLKKLNVLEDPHRRRLAAAAGEIVRLLHSRAKPSVQERLAVSPVSEQEAELAVSCAGSILRELGWAEWRA
jgi:hypothetical protein